MPAESIKPVSRLVARDLTSLVIRLISTKSSVAYRLDVTLPLRYPHFKPCMLAEETALRLSSGPG
jgi:hypothetical protein